MHEELDAFIGAAWRECTPKRKGSRNVTYTRDLATSMGWLEEDKTLKSGLILSTIRSILF